MASKTSRRTGKAKSGKVKAKRASRSRPLVSDSGSIRRAPRPARQGTTGSKALAGALPLLDAMHRFALANIDHAGRLAACRTPMEFWLEHMRFGKNLFAQWQSSAQSGLPGFGTR